MTTSTNPPTDHQQTTQHQHHTHNPHHHHHHHHKHTTDGSADIDTDRANRRKLKKLRKRVKKGLLSLADTEACKKYGMVVRAEADWGPELLEGKRPHLMPEDLRKAILHVLTGGGHVQCPDWLKLMVCVRKCIYRYLRLF